MGNNTNQTIDTLIKSIYQSYIDIKTDDFQEIKKDILLDNIKELYVMVKEFTPNTTLNKETKIAVEKELTPMVETNTTPISEIEIPAQPIQVEKTPVAEKIVEEAPKVVETESSNDNNVEFDIENKAISEKSSEKIIDFLKNDNSPNKDIYDLLDINTRIGLVEIFFKGDSLALSESLSKLNQITEKSKCLEIIKRLADKYKIDKDDDIYKTFTNLIERKLG